VRVIGLTGGIGSGKSSLAAAFAGLGVPVLDADRVARDCVAPGSDVLQRIVERFGPAVVLEDGGLDRAALAAIVFADAAARAELEAITHPCIRSGIASWVAARRGHEPAPDLVLVEHPLLVETGADADVDLVIVVEAPEDLRIARLWATRGMDGAEARRRSAAQADDTARRQVADHVVVNDGELADLDTLAADLLHVLRDGA
jgi:dephospho-CoA kinase